MAKQQHKLTADEVIGKPQSNKLIALATIGLLLIVVGAVIPIFLAANSGYTQMPQYYKFIYAAGALLLLTARILYRYTGVVLRVRRLYRIEMWSALFFCVATFFLFYQPNQSRDWIAFTLAGGILQLFTSIMIPRVINKELKDND